MTQAAEPIATGQDAAADLKRYKYHSLTDWLLLRKILMPAALVLCAVALIGGVAMPLDQRPISAGVVVLLLAVSFVIYAVVLQRNAFAMRFESGPLLLDLPRKLPAVLLLFVIFAPAFLFATAHHTRIALSGGDQIIRTEQALKLFVTPNDDGPNEALPQPQYYSEVTAENLPALQAEVRVWQAALRARIQTRSAAARDSLGQLYTRMGWPAREQEIVAASIDDAARSMNASVDRIEEPRAGAYYYPSSVAFNNCYEVRSICVILDRLDYFGAAQETLGISRSRGSWWGNSEFASAAPFAIMFSGFGGLLLTSGFALIGAILLRILRLSRGSTPYLAGGLLAFVAAFLIFTTLAASIYRSSGSDGVSLFNQWFFGVPAYVLALAPLALGFIRPLRRDGWGGLIVRLIALTFPLVPLTVAVAFLIGAYSATNLPAFPLSLATFLPPAVIFALVCWPVWVVLDRMIIRGNCAPTRGA